MRTSTPLAPLLALVAALVAVGCGGGGEATLSKTDFIKRADAICEKADSAEIGEFFAYARAHPKLLKRLHELTSSDQPPRGVVAREKAYGAIAPPSILKEAEEIEALKPPSGDEAAIERFLAGIRQAVKEAEGDPSKLDNHLPNGAGANPDYAFGEVNQLATEYGFKQCNEIA